ncbi:MAG: hypothetical protein GTO17_12000 [Candidatus Aminicenantes bacterium]|nr:hypothetical protein [Candidatus Aminicenantes bacterium]
MIDPKLRIKYWLSWLWVFLCALAIFLVVPTARAIQSFVSARWGRPLFGYSVLFIIVSAFVILVYVLVFRLKIRSPSNYIWLSVVAGLYVYFTIRLWRAPEEAVHFLEYGLLGFFLFRALSFTIKDKTIYLAAILIGSLVGIFDEILQWIMPLRYWDLRDVGLNAFSVVLFQTALWKGIQPKIISEKIKSMSIRLVSSLLAANILLLGICMSNTPQRVARYTKLIPGLSFLQKEETMTEFRHKHRDPEIGVFYSRLSLEKLEKTDKERSFTYAQILKEWMEKDYENFLRDFSGSTHPFLHELRVHIFRRDKKYEAGLLAEDEKKKREALFIAYKENLILEKYFGRTFRKSEYKWTKEKTKETEVLIDKSQFYRSAVSYGLFSSFGEITMWLSIFAFLALLVLFNVWIAPKLRK